MKRFEAKCSGSTSHKSWKERLRAQLMVEGVDLVPDGPVEMHVSWQVDAELRNWINLWKPTIDSFGRILGEPSANPFHPADDRITRLHLHVVHDDSIGFDVVVRAWWRPVLSV